MNPPPYGFLSEFLPAIDFGESFWFDGCFDFDDSDKDSGVSDESNSPSFGRYDDIPCLLSIESHVQLRHCRHHWKNLRKKHCLNHLYCKDSVTLSSWYRNFILPGLTHDLTHELSSADSYGEFCSLFQMPLSKVEELMDIFISHGYIQQPWSLKFWEEFREHAELFVISALYRLGNGNSFCQCRSLCHISVSEIRKFFFLFIGAMVKMKEEYICLPLNIIELRWINKYYDNVGLPGCCSSMDVMHVKWLSCPTGDHNCAKGKAGYPTLELQCITNFNRRVIGIHGPNFGSWNDKEIVKVNPNVHHIQTGWFKDVCWKYYTAEGRVKEDQGAYSICDDGYHRWPTLICPSTNATNATLEGYFSTNLESVRKDVESTFGILKKQWNVLNNGFYYRDINICELMVRWGKKQATAPPLPQELLVCGHFVVSYFQSPFPLHHGGESCKHEGAAASRAATSPSADAHHRQHMPPRWQRGYFCWWRNGPWWKNLRGGWHPVWAHCTWCSGDILAAHEGNWGIPTCPASGWSWGILS